MIGQLGKSESAMQGVMQGDTTTFTALLGMAAAKPKRLFNKNERTRKMGQQIRDLATGFLNGLASAMYKKRAAARKLSYQDPVVPTPGDSLGGNTRAQGRLTAGNIDQPGSEAYNRWGQGKVTGDAAELAREGARATPLDAGTAKAGELSPPAIPAANAETSLAEYEKAWNEDLPHQDTAQAGASAPLTDEPW